MDFTTQPSTQNQLAASRPASKTSKRKTSNFGDEDDHAEANSYTDPPSAGRDQVYIVCICKLSDHGSLWPNYTFTQAEMNEHKVTIDWVGHHKHKAQSRLRETMQSWRALHYRSHLEWGSAEECNLFRTDDMRDGDMLAKGWIAGPETARDVMTVSGKRA